MELAASDNENDLFKRNEEPTALVTVSDLEISDSDDDMSSIADDALEQYNISSNIKNIIRMGNHDVNVGLDHEDSESDDDLLRERNATIDIAKLNEEIAKNKYKFSNFGAPEQEALNEDEDQSKKKKKKLKTSKEKKKRRDKGKEKLDVFEAQQEDREDNLSRVLKRFEQEDSDNGYERAKKKHKRSGRKTRKINTNEITVDENGEKMIRTTTLLDDSSSSSDEERPLTKKEEEEMYRDNERMRRSKKISLKPVYNIKSFDEFIKRRTEREEEYLKQLEDNKITNSSSPIQPSNSAPKDDSDDSDIEIIGDPKKIAASLLSPERARYPMANWSPMKHSTTSFRNYNRLMLSRITNEGYEYRIKMETAAKARGQYASATERAKRLLEKERDALMINEQINKHFERNKNKSVSDEDDEDDEDYKEDDVVNEYSGSEEEFLVEEAGDQIELISKGDSGNTNKVEDGNEEEEDMATAAFKKWRNKKGKKSIFDDDDDEIDNSKKVPKKPEPAHSIANFFKAKQQKTDELSIEQSEPKTLSRLVQKEKDENNDNKGDDDEEEEEEQEDSMDIDESSYSSATQKPVTKKTKEKSEYLEEEAEEEEDEFFGAGGSDGEDNEDLDEYEKDDMLVEDNNEIVDEAALRDVFNKQDEESDKNFIQRLITDIAGGGLRKQKAAAEAGLMLEDIDLYDNEDNDLISIRMAAAARRRKLLKARGGDILDTLLKDPKTAAFAKAAQAIPDEAPIAFLSDDEAEAIDEDDMDDQLYKEHSSSKRIIIEEDDEDDEDEDGNKQEDEKYIEEENEVDIEHNEKEVHRKGLEDIFSDDEDLIVEDDDYERKRPEQDTTALWEQKFQNKSNF